mgnify:CR=1 FL=1
MDSRHAGLTESDIAQLQTVELRELDRALLPAPDVVPAAPTASESRVPWALLDKKWTPLLALGWPAVYALLLTLAPAAPEQAANTAEAAPSLLETLGALFLLGTMTTTALALLRNRFMAPIAAVATGATGLAAHIGCAAGGHVSPTAGWFVVTLAAMVAMTVVSVQSLRRQLV